LDGVVFTAIVALGLLPLLQSVISEHGERKARKTAERHSTLRELLAGVLIGLVDAAQADWKKTGVQVFVVAEHWWLWESQDRAAKLRLAHIEPSGIKWTKGKGLIGRCWETGRPLSKNLETHFAPLRGLSQSQWERRTATVDAYGLTYEEFQKIGHKYGLVAVFPLTRGDEYVGCITADMPPECSQSVDTAKVMETLSGAAPSIAAVVVGG
jgi:hypothetical protein